MEFTDWAPFKNIINAPEIQGVFQIRIYEGLLDYPTGKTTMLYYGYGNNLRENLVEFKNNILPHLSFSKLDLLVRWLPDKNAKVRFEQRMNAFVNKFSMMPIGNEEWLKHLDNS